MENTSGEAVAEDRGAEGRGGHGDHPTIRPGSRK
jgi:hypothetical protein